MANNRMGAALAAILCLMPSVFAAASEEPVALKTVLQKVDGYLRSIQYAECTYHMVAQSLTDPKISLDRSYEYRADIFGREYSSRKPWPPGNTASGFDRYAWNGKIMKTYTGVEGGVQQGSVQATPPGGLDCSNPIMASLEFIGKRLKTLTSLYSTPSILTGVERTADDEIYSVRFEEIAPMANVPGGYYTTVWFSRKRGFAPVKRTDEMNGKLLQELVLEQQEVSPGIWLPVRLIGKGYALPMSREAIQAGERVVAGPVPTGLSTTEVDPGSYKINIPDTEGKFDLTFPNGVRVIDFVAGTIYVTGDAESLQHFDVKPPRQPAPPAK